MYNKTNILCFLFSFTVLANLKCWGFEIGKAKNSIDTSFLTLAERDLVNIISLDNPESLIKYSTALISSDIFLDKYTLLTYAVSRGSTKCAKALITHGAPVNQLDKFKVSPLVHALCWQQYELAQLLLDSGASVNLPQGEEPWGIRSPLWMFRSALENRLYVWEYYLDQIHWLLQHEANANATLADRTTFLLSVFQHCNCPNAVRLIGWLCESGADVNARLYCYRNQTIMHHAVLLRSSFAELSSENRIPILHHLISAGGDLNAQDENLSTPLHEAIKNNEKPDAPLSCRSRQTNADCIAYLIYSGANPEFKDSQGKKPIDYAKQPEIISMLESPKSVVLPERVKEILQQLKKPNISCEKIA